MKEYRETRVFLGAYVTIRFFYPGEREPSADMAARKCWQRMEEIHREMNAYSQDSEVVKINNSGVYGVQVNPQVYGLIKDALHFAQLTEGAFDLTVFPLVELWREAARAGRLPDNAALAAAREKVGYQNLLLKEPDRVVLTKAGMKIDLGGIVSGYACDEISAILRSYDIQNFLIDAGGEIFCGGKKNGEGPWLIGVQDPQDKNAKLMNIVIEDACVSTSGSYEKFYTIEQKKFSHLIDPLSGYSQKDVISATVIAKTGREADALSTALCVLGSAKGMALVRRLKDVEALMIENKGGRVIKYRSIGFPRDG